MPGLDGRDARDSLGALPAPDRGPGGLRARTPRPPRADAGVDDPRRLPRRDGHPRRGHPPGAAARPHLPARAGGGAGDARRDATDGLPGYRDGRPARRGPASSASSGPLCRPAGQRPPGAQRRHHARAHVRTAGAPAHDSWDDVQVWFADERCVPPQDEESNYRLAEETLLGPAAIPALRVHRMEGELGPDEGAARYAGALAEVPRRGRRQPACARPGRARHRPRRARRLAVPRGAHARRRRAGAVPRRPRLAQAAARADHAEPAPCCAPRAAACCSRPAPARPTRSRRCSASRPRHVPASLLRRERLTVIVDDAAAPPGHPQ